MGKYFTLLFLIAGIVGIVWGVRVNWADGSWILAAGGIGLFLLVGLINKSRGLPWFSDSSAGH